jgi:hypothetical protein
MYIFAFAHTYKNINYAASSGELIPQEIRSGVGKVRVGKKACVWQQRRVSRWRLPNSCLCVRSPGTVLIWPQFVLQLTARQYGEVVLSDEASGQGPGTLARKLSRCKEGMAHFLLSEYKLCELYECRGTSLIGTANLSSVIKLVAGTGAVSRYKLSRSQEFVMV